MKPKFNSTKYIPFVIVFLVLTMAIGYAVINSVTFDIKGESKAITQDGIFITEVNKLSSTGTESYETKLAYQNILDGRVELDDEANSTISIEVSFYNSTDYDYKFSNVVYQNDLEDAYSNTNISYTFDNKNKIIKSADTLTITLTFNYLDKSNITETLLNFIFNFKFSPIYEVAFDYTGSSQTWNVPYTGTYKIELWGASGGDNNTYRIIAETADGTYAERDAKFVGGYGGYTSGEIELTKKDILYIYVGEQGKRNLQGTFNGGGAGAIGGTGYNGTNIDGDSNLSGNSGGGATDIRLIKGTWNNFDSLKSRIMVAGGGGGSTVDSYSQAGEYSNAGGLNGFNGGYYFGHPFFETGQNGKGGTQKSGGKAASIHFNAIGNTYDGKFGIGGITTSISSQTGAGGGGGGYYGGSGASGTLAGGSGQGGGGGSSFISGHNGCDAILESSTDSNIIHSGQSIHYSNYYFTNTLMIDGFGYAWTTKQDIEYKMPSYNEELTTTGNLGNGYAKITLLEIK